MVSEPLSTPSLNLAPANTIFVDYHANTPSHRPFGTGSFLLRIPGTSCQATIRQSLRDKKHENRDCLSAYGLKPGLGCFRLSGDANWCLWHNRSRKPCS